MTPRVSILINNYNYGRFLRQSIESALTQTYVYCEVVVVDDGSTDESREIIASYGDRIKPVLKDNGGQGSAYNAGFACATGDICMFLDSDDYLKPEAAERVVSRWEPGTHILHHRLEVVDNTGRKIGCWPSESTTIDAGEVVPQLLRRGEYSAPPSSGLVYSREMLLRLLPVDEAMFRIGADSWLFLQAPFYAPVVALDTPVACYRAHGGNTAGATWPTRLSTRAKLEAFVRLLNLNHTLIKKQAGIKNLVFDSGEWENPITLRWRLILNRLDLSAIAEERRGDLARSVLNCIQQTPYDPIRRLKERLIVYLIWLGPQVLLKFMFPNMFKIRSNEQVKDSLAPI